MMKQGLLLLAVLLSACGSDPQKPKLTRSERDAVRQYQGAAWDARHKVLSKTEYIGFRIGMSYPEACALMGRDAEEVARSEGDGVVIVIRQWKNEEGPGVISGTFQNGRLISKAQVGLED